jgi:hypothetical protein
MLPGRRDGSGAMTFGTMITVAVLVLGPCQIIAGPGAVDGPEAAERTGGAAR